MRRRPLGSPATRFSPHRRPSSGSSRLETASLECPSARRRGGQTRSGSAERCQRRASRPSSRMTSDTVWPRRQVEGETVRDCKVNELDPLASVALRADQPSSTAAGSLTRTRLQRLDCRENRPCFGLAEETLGGPTGLGSTAGPINQPRSVVSSTPNWRRIEAIVPSGIRFLSSGMTQVLCLSPGLPGRAQTRCVPRRPLPSLRRKP